MWILSIMLTAALAACVLGKPQVAPAETDSNSTPIPIISESDISNPDGSFDFGFITGNGIKVEESGFLKPNPNTNSTEDHEIQVLNGTFSYTAPDGTQISLAYVADENGFQPTGDHLPTPPPIPEDIQKSLALLAQKSTTD